MRRKRIGRSNRRKRNPRGSQPVQGSKPAHPWLQVVRPRRRRSTRSGLRRLQRARQLSQRLHAQYGKKAEPRPSAVSRRQRKKASLHPSGGRSNWATEWETQMSDGPQDLASRAIATVRKLLDRGLRTFPAEVGTPKMSPAMPIRPLVRHRASQLSRGHKCDVVDI